MNYIFITGYECNTLYAYPTFAKAYKALKQEIINDGNEDILNNSDCIEGNGTSRLIIDDFYWIKEIEFKE